MKQLKETTNELRNNSGAKYDTSHAELNRPQHALDVISDKSEKSECKLPTGPPHDTQPQTDVDVEAEGWEVAPSSKKRKKGKSKKILF